MAEFIDTLGASTIFALSDSNWGYWHIPIDDEDKDKTTFKIHFGTYRFNRMPLELLYAPSTLERALDALQNNYNWKSCLVYLEYIIT